MRSYNSAYRGGAQSDTPNVGIVTHPFLARASKTPLDNLIDLVKPAARTLFVITGGDYENTTSGIVLTKLNATRRTRFTSRVLEQAFVQMQTLLLIAKRRKDIDILIFFLGTSFPAPILLAQALDMKCYIVIADLGRGEHIRAIKESGALRQSGELTLLRLAEVLQRMSYFFSDKLIVYSRSVIDQLKLQRYRGKIIVSHRHFLNFDEYRFKNNIEARDNVVGYVGRLNKEKGALNFVKAIPEIISTRNDVTFFMIGEGDLEDKIRAHLETMGLNGHVKLTGWIPHHELPDYLTRLKLLVIPSYNEGLPNIMIEAMACGTPVLATPIGSIPDVLTDNETGFLIHDNSPTRLAENIAETLACPELRRITINARMLVETEFRYEKLKETWKEIICSTNS